MQAVEKLIRWYREGKFPIDKLVTYFEVRSPSSYFQGDQLS
jgi:Zn-dependent alcohol dehydrogenase